MELVERLTRALASRDEVVAAWLFGSRARDRSHLRSDADVAVLFRDPQSTTLDAYRFDLAADLATEVGVPVDLVPIQRASADLVHRVLRDGILLCDRDRARRIAFEVKKRAEYLDMAPIWRQYRRLPART